jgi:RES domain
VSQASQFDLLYFAEDPQTALFEVQAMLGSPHVPGGAIAHPRRTFTIINAMILLGDACDLTIVSSAQVPLDTSAQELTGDWDGYQLRATSLTSVAGPTGIAPTQALGQALFNTGIEGFRSISAKVPYTKTLIVFPDNLKPGSSIVYVDPRNGSVIRRVAPP